jgi:general secretion pathway protein G
VIKKSAFTMIELIFVIVILALLAVVAIPRLAATRADAKSSTKAYSIMTATTEIASYAVSKGQIKSDLSEMSNSIFGLVDSGEAVLDIANKKATISANTVADCISMQISIDDTLTMTFGSAAGDNECMRIQSLIDLNTFPILLMGTRVKY